MLSRIFDLISGIFDLISGLDKALYSTLQAHARELAEKKVRERERGMPFVTPKEYRELVDDIARQVPHLDDIIRKRFVDHMVAEYKKKHFRA